MAQDPDARISVHGSRLAARSPRWWRWLMAAAAGAVAGCASYRQTASEVAIREPGHRMLGELQPVGPEARRDLEFAWLAEAAYGKTPAGRRARERHAAAPAAACPQSEDALLAAGWSPWPGFPDDGLHRRIERFHLRVEVWIRKDPPIVAVTFGGTVFNNENDWLSNLRWFLPFHRDEYTETVQEFAPALVAEFRRRLESGDAQWEFLRDAKLMAVGHSLGGGLAQQFAYGLPRDGVVQRVDQVYAFDPSPVTGFYSVDGKTRDENVRRLAIERIYERGEILAILRAMTSFFVPPSAADPSIRGVRYALFYPADPIAGHSMTELACRMYAAAGSAP